MIDWIEFHPFTWAAGIKLIVLILLLCISAFVSGSEAAFFSLSPGEVSELSKRNSRGARAALRLLGMEDYLLATILITNNLVNICAVIVANSIVDDLTAFHRTGVEFAVKTVLLTFLLLLFGEIMPKLAATANASRLAPVAALPLLFLRQVLKPFSWVLIHSGNAVGRRMSLRRNDLSMDELSDAIQITADQSVEEKRILSGIVHFVNTSAEEIMRPRVDIVAVDVEADFPTVCQRVLESGFSRIPVYAESMDNIKGILYVKDILPYLDSERDFEWQKLIREPYFVPGHKKINDLFAEFQTGKIHIAIVVDEYGSTLGLVSLEDILEEIIGEIADESDVDSSYYTRIDPNTYLFEGKTHIIDFLKVTGFPDDYLDEFRGDSETLAGVMIEARRDFLKVGDTVRLRALTLTVEALEGRRIARIRVHIENN